MSSFDWEVMPERGVSGGGAVERSSSDSRGQAAEKASTCHDVMASREQPSAGKISAARETTPRGDHRIRHAPSENRGESPRKMPQKRKNPLLPRGLSENRVEGRGFEQSVDSSLKTEDSDQPAVKTAVTPEGRAIDPLLGRLVVAWDRLSHAERLAVLEFAESRIPPGR